MAAITSFSLVYLSALLLLAEKSALLGAAPVIVATSALPPASNDISLALNPHNFSSFGKTTEYMSPAELALSGKLEVGDILEEIEVHHLEGGKVLELPIFHFAVVVNNSTLQVVHYRSDNSSTANVTPESIIKETINSAKKDLERKLSSITSTNQDVSINCRSYFEDGLARLSQAYSEGGRTVHKDNLVAGLAYKVRVNNGFDERFGIPFPAKEIASRAESRIGENKFNLRSYNCETFAHWARNGVNYSEQAERLNSTVEVALSKIDSLCARAHKDLREVISTVVSDEESRVKQRTTDAAVPSGVICTAGIIASFFFPPAGVVACGGGAIYTLSTLQEETDAALRRGQSRIREEILNKMETGYKSELVSILKEIVIGLRLESIVEVMKII